MFDSCLNLHHQCLNTSRCSVTMSLSFNNNPSETLNLYFLIQTNAHVGNSCGLMWIKYSTQKVFFKKAADVFVSILINIIWLCLTAGLGGQCGSVCLASDENVARQNNWRCRIESPDIELTWIYVKVLYDLQKHTLKKHPNIHSLWLFGALQKRKRKRKRNKSFWILWRPGNHLQTGRC